MNQFRDGRIRPRSPEEVERRQKAEEARLRELSKPTGRPMPRFLMGDKSELPMSHTGKP